MVSVEVLKHLSSFLRQTSIGMSFHVVFWLLEKRVAHAALDLQTFSQRYSDIHVQRDTLKGLSAKEFAVTATPLHDGHSWQNVCFADSLVEPPFLRWEGEEKIPVIVLGRCQKNFPGKSPRQSSPNLHSEDPRHICANHLNQPQGY